MTFLLQEIAEEMFRGNTKTALATILLAWEAGHQYAIDGNSWRAAWPLTGMEDPYEQPRWAASPEQLSVVSGLLRAQEDLGTKLRTGTFPVAARGAGAGLGQEEDEDGKVVPPQTRPFRKTTKTAPPEKGAPPKKE